MVEDGTGSDSVDNWEVPGLDEDNRVLQEKELDAEEVVGVGVGEYKVVADTGACVVAWPTVMALALVGHPPDVVATVDCERSLNGKVSVSVSSAVEDTLYGSQGTPEMQENSEHTASASDH